MPMLDSPRYGFAQVASARGAPARAIALSTSALTSALVLGASLAIAFIVALAMAPIALAAPTDPVVVSLPPANQGAAFVPGIRTLADLPRDYVEEEFFVSGAASLYNYAHNPPLGPDDIVSMSDGVPYTTRIIVRRPAKSQHFNGAVVVEWWNSTAGFDSAPVWDVSAEYFAREGYAYVGVTNSTTSFAFLTGGCRLFNILPPTCDTRYAALSMPDNGLAYEMVSQLANALKRAGSAGMLPSHYRVKRLYHAGQSQQGGSIITYASAFHFDANDGYFVQQMSGARPLNSGRVCGTAGTPPFPACTPALQGDLRLVRTDLPVPVYHAVTETDIQLLFGTLGRQADTPTFRYYEVAGAGHLTVHKDVEILPGDDPLFLEDLCLNELNTTADGPVFYSYVANAMWDNLEKQVRFGRTPPAGIVLDLDPVSGAIARDAHGNALGGVRLPAMEVPIATYTPGNVANPTLPPFLQSIGNLACFLGSSVAPFDDATLRALYPNHGRYVAQVAHAANRLRQQRLLLSRDSAEILVQAAHSKIGCGLGFELVFVVPLLMALRTRSRLR